MYEMQFGVYLGKETTEGFSGFLVEGNVCVVLEVENGISSNEGREILKSLKTHLISSPPSSFESFENLMLLFVKESNLPSHFSMSSGYLKGGIMYLKTIGSGVVFLYRNHQFGKLIGDSNMASGYIAHDDFYLFTTERFIQYFNNEKELGKILQQKNPHEVINEITPHLKSKEDDGIIALFIKLKEQTQIPLEGSGLEQNSQSE